MQSQDQKSPEETGETAPRLDSRALRCEVRALMSGVRLRDLTDDELAGIVEILGPARLRVALQEGRRPVLLRVLDAPAQ